MAVVVLVCCLNQSLKFRHVVGVRKVDYINRDIVLSETFAELFEFGLLFVKRVATEYDNSRLGILVDSVLQRQLGDLDGGHKVSFSIDWDIGHSSKDVTNLSALSNVQLASVSRHRHDSKGVFRVLLKFDVADVRSSIILTLPS